MAICSETLSDLASQLSGLAGSASSEADKNAAATAIAEQILSAVRGPLPDWMARLFTVTEVTALKLFLDWGALDIIPDQGTISFGELARKLDADDRLIRRICWILIAGGTLRQYGKDRVAHTDKSRQYLAGTPDGLLLQMVFDEHMLPALKLPEYFVRFGRHEPATRTNTPHAFSLGQPEKEIWEIQQQDPERMKRFIKAMEVSQRFIPMVGIYDFDWVESKLSEEPDRIVLVDVGGGKGHAIKAILEENPFLPPERFVLEDRDEVINEVKALKEPELQGVHLQVYDFHKPQPVKSALIYWMRRCLHDYGDDVCAQMLQQLSDAMAEDSKLLINEYVLPNPPPPLAAMTDFGMLEIGGRERTAEDWETLVARAGLKIEKLHGLDKKMQVVECVKAI